MRSTAAAFIDETRARVQFEYGHEIGRAADEVATPALLLDLDAATRNVTRMAAEMSALPSELRPHIKVHKSPDLVQLQAEHGVRAVTTATVWEAAVMLASGIDDIFVANTIAGPDQARFLTALARAHRVLVAVDDPGNADWLSELAVKAGARLGVMIEVDTGMDRAGVDTEAQAVALARHVVELPGLRLEGISGYEGHCSGIVDDAARERRQHEAMAFFVHVAELLADDGIPVPIRSAGGTSTWKLTAAFAGITEVQAGSYVVMDNFHGRMIKEFEHALTVAATVISRPSDRMIVDAGNKTIAVSHLASLRGLDLPNLRFDEEHGVFGIGEHTPEIGDQVRIIPGYAPTTINTFDAFHVIRDNVVIDIWPVVPRGPGGHGLARAG